MNTIANTTDQLLNMIRSGKLGRDKAIGELYANVNLRNSVKNMVYRNGGREDDVNTVYNSMLVQFVKTVVKRQDLVIDGPLHGYMTGIAKYIWYKTARDKTKHQTTDLADSP